MLNPLNHTTGRRGVGEAVLIAVLGTVAATLSAWGLEAVRAKAEKRAKSQKAKRKKRRPE